MAGSGSTTINMLGVTHGSVAVTGQTNILSGSLVEAWIFPKATADHTADEHRFAGFRVYAADVVAGTGFTIYGDSTDDGNVFRGLKGIDHRGSAFDAFVYGIWNVAWAWV